MIAQLVIYAKSLGYDLTYGDAYRDDRVFGKVGVSKGYGHKSSNHKRRLAVDFNLFINGIYITNNKHYKILHKFWRSIGGSTIPKDLNHFSILYRGQKWVI